MDEVIDYILEAFKKAETLGAEFVDARLQSYDYELIVYDNGLLKEHTYTARKGLGFRVIYKGAVAYGSTARLSRESIIETVEETVRAARSLSNNVEEKVRLADYKAVQAKARSSYIVDPFTVDLEKLEIAETANKVAMEVKGVVSAVTRLGVQRDRRIVLSSEGTHVDVETVMTGISQASIAKGEKGLEYASDYESRVAGFEFIRSMDWEEMARETSTLAVVASNADVPKGGEYEAVLEPRVVGLLLHEALGHASEGDLVASGSSVLEGRLGSRIGSEKVTIYDDGLVPGGYYVPYDDEGVEKEKVMVVENGVLKGLLADRVNAYKLGLKPTGNGRVMYYSNPVIVRQTNYYMEPGDYSFEELIEDIDYGIYTTAKGAKGGQVDPGMGTFTFSVGVSWLIEKGKLSKPLRGVSLTGQILEVLSRIDAVGRDFEVETSVFGGCGKGGQLVRVGTGGPHVRVKGIVVGGR
ncbi:MAG: TldD/PmbA family protein [Desulfurococcales archaeon]|nr:TldD/PmbA family protein [Desulfurococcales archaeon]